MVQGIQRGPNGPRYPKCIWWYKVSKGYLMVQGLQKVPIGLWFYGIQMVPNGQGIQRVPRGPRYPKCTRQRHRKTHQYYDLALAGLCKAIFFRSCCRVIWEATHLKILSHCNKAHTFDLNHILLLWHEVFSEKLKLNKCNGSHLSSECTYSVQLNKPASWFTVH